MKQGVLLFLVAVWLCSCAVQKYDPRRKFGPGQLEYDYSLFRSILEESHPSLYWYTPRDSMDLYFEQGAAKLKDSLTEAGFRNVLSYVISKIRCGHTAVRPSRPASRFTDSFNRARLFPLSLKIWGDTAMVTANLNRRDSQIVRGVVLHSIDGRPMREIVDSFFSHLTSDGHNLTHKYQTLSNPGVFRGMYASIYGLKPRTPVTFTDTLGRTRTAELRLYAPVRDTTAGARVRTAQSLPPRRERRRMMLKATRSFHVDTALNAGVLELNTFTKGYHLRGFFRRSFRELRRQNVPNLVVDLRGNFGGSVSNSNLLTRYLADEPFKIADSLYAITNRSSYGRYQDNYFFNRLFFISMVRRKKDGNYHFSYFENRYFRPKRRNHFNGTVYILTGGNTFSAATLVTGSVKKQPNVVVVGEETGGGAYGNTAWLIPDITLPLTGVRFRLPLFRLVIDKNEVPGRGILPEVEVLPTTGAIRRSADFKMEKVAELIRQSRETGRVQRFN